MTSDPPSCSFSSFSGLSLRRSIVLGLVSLAMPPIVRAEETRPVHRLGMLYVVSDPNKAIPPFWDELARLGWSRGKTLVVDERVAPQDQGVKADLVAAARELVALKPDVIATFGGPAVRALMGVTTTIPIVFAWIPDPEQHGFVQSLSRPGGNVTGAASFHMDLIAKRLDVLTQMVPGVKRIGLLLNPEPPRMAALYLKMKDDWSRSLGVELDVEMVRRPAEIERAVGALARRGAGAVMELGDWMLGPPRNLHLISSFASNCCARATATPTSRCESTGR